jgi:hypothetical protein
LRRIPQFATARDLRLVADWLQLDTLAPSDRSSRLGQDQAVADELASGGSALQRITFGGYFSVPGGVAWDGKYLAVAFADSEAIYRFKAGPYGATLVDQHDFALADHGFFGIAIHKHRLVTIAGPLDDEAFNFLAKFQYPTGAKDFNQQSTGLPRGIAISVGSPSAETER